MKSDPKNGPFRLCANAGPAGRLQRFLRICPFTQRPMISIYRRLIDHMIFGGLIGALALHPLSMTAHNLFHPNEKTLRDIFDLAFSYEHIPMTLFFVLVGCAFGLINGIWMHLISKLHEKIRTMAISDELTGLYNRRFFVHRLQHEMARAHRYGGRLSLLMLDIDFFKHYNDLHGHLAGDEVLRRTGHLLRGLVRQSDIVARYGGEEFVILMPETNAQIIYELANRICTAISCHPFKHRRRQPGGKITVSIGLAEYPPDAQNAHELIHRADQALYLAKQRGKNRVNRYRSENG